jgi:ATP synthase subunit 6
MLHSPLEQFQLTALIPIRLGWFDISFTNSSLLMVMVCITIIGLIGISTLHSTIIPGRWQSVVELLYEFTYGILHDNVGKEGHRYIPFIFVLFSYILFCNLLGMVPYSFTVTSHISVTFALAFSCWVGVTIIGFVTHGIHFFSLFMPSGTPLALAPLLVLIEVISYMFRSISLGVRLFANMMAGHTLLKIMAGFGWTLLGLGGIYSVIGLAPCLLLFIFTVLEVGVAVLQAYIFTILVCIYLNDSIHLH